MIVKCPSCKGGKEVMGIGMLTQKCKKCKGSGKVQIVNVDTYVKAGEKFVSEIVKVETDEKAPLKVISAEMITEDEQPSIIVNKKDVKVVDKQNNKKDKK